MKPGQLHPIPMPSAQRWREARATVLPLMVFLGAVVVIGCLWRERISSVTLVGSPADVVWASGAVGAVAPLSIVGYRRPAAGIEPKPGDPVHVRTLNQARAIGTAQILEVGLQFEALPQSLQASLNLAGMERALTVSISLPAESELCPGELVDLSLISVFD